MILQLAVSRSAARSRSRQALANARMVPAANDNAQPGTSDQNLELALRHFAKYGINAARVARKEAEQAFFDGNRPAYDHWLGVCRTLDRRLANMLEHDCLSGKS